MHDPDWFNLVEVWFKSIYVLPSYPPKVTSTIGVAYGGIDDISFTNL